MRKYISIALVFLLTACGFHPRGVITADNAGSFGNIIGTKFYVEANNFNPFANDIRSSLSGYKAKIVNDEKDADYIINIQDVQKRSQLTSVVGGASNNTYQLIYAVKYNVVKPNEKTPVIPNKVLNTQQFWQSNTGTQLAQNNEADRIYKYLQSQLVNNMVSQMAALLPDDTSSYDSKSQSDNKESSKKST